MQPEIFNIKLKSLKIRQVEFATLCGVSEVQVSKWANGHADIPKYAQTIITLIEQNEENKAIEKLKKIAGVISDGHYTICKFTTNYRVGLGTASDRNSIDKMSAGVTIKEAIESIFSQIQVANYI